MSAKVGIFFLVMMFLQAYSFHSKVEEQDKLIAELKVEVKSSKKNYNDNMVSVALAATRYTTAIEKKHEELLGLLDKRLIKLESRKR